MALPTPTIHSAEVYEAHDGGCAYYLYFTANPNELEGINVGVFRGGQYVDCEAAELSGNGNHRIATSSPCNTQVSVRVVLYTGTGSGRREAFSNAHIFTPTY